MDTRIITCISCPIGCSLTVETLDGKLVGLSGNKCARGKTYAENELYDPRRTLTSTVALLKSTKGQLPVRTKEPIPKNKLKEAMEALKEITVTAPVKMGDIIVKDFVETGISLIATRSMKDNTEKK